MSFSFFSIVSSVLLFNITFAAQADYTTRDFTASRTAAQKNGFVSDEVFNFNHEDSVRISGVSERTNLIVTNHDQNDNAYFMPIGLVNANYSVNRDRIRLVLKDGRRHALIYKLDYTTYDGKKGFQIITIRLAEGRKAQQNTCTLAVFDSQSAFSDYQGNNKEEHLWEQAKLATKNKEFSYRTCIPAEEHSHEERSAPVIDLEEGDSQETSI